MNVNKFTQKSIESIQECDKIAMEYGNQTIDQEHFLHSLVTINDSLIAKLIERMEIDINYFDNRVVQAIEALPKVQGGERHMSQALNDVLVSAEDEAKKMGDEYVSVEHLFLSMLKNLTRQ